MGGGTPTSPLESLVPGPVVIYEIRVVPDGDRFKLRREKPLRPRDSITHHGKIYTVQMVIPDPDRKSHAIAEVKLSIAPAESSNGAVGDAAAGLGEGRPGSPAA